MKHMYSRQFSQKNRQAILGGLIDVKWVGEEQIEESSLANKLDFNDSTIWAFSDATLTWHHAWKVYFSFSFLLFWDGNASCSFQINGRGDQKCFSRLGSSVLPNGCRQSPERKSLSRKKFLREWLSVWRHWDSLRWDKLQSHWDTTTTWETKFWSIQMAVRLDRAWEITLCASGDGYICMATRLKEWKSFSLLFRHRAPLQM